MDSTVAIARRSTRLRRWLPVAAIAVAAVTAGTYFLGASGSTGLSISPPGGLSSKGEVADVTTMSSTVTRSNGGAQLSTGVTVAKISVASLWANKIRVEIAWTNAGAALSILNNPHAQISIGLYHTIHTGNCNGTVGTTVDAPLINLTDNDISGTAYCAALDQSATGSPSVSSGKLLLTTSDVGGNLNPALDGSSSLSACPAASTDPNNSAGWCQPASVTDASTRALYVIASITIPGTIPPSQQASVSTLGFFVHVRRIS